MSPSPIKLNLSVYVPNYMSFLKEIPTDLLMADFKISSSCLKIVKSARTT